MTTRGKGPPPAQRDLVPTGVKQPGLPSGVDWHPRTRVWWKAWKSEPQSAFFSVTDWEFLIDTALLHSAMWSGNLQLAAEVRLRAAKFGATLEDRARLRIHAGPAPAASDARAADDLEAKRLERAKRLTGT